MCPDVSVGVVTHNSAGDIGELLAGLQGAAVFVCDNASTDGTCVIVRAAGAPCLKLDKNEGYGAAHNRLLPSLSSRYHVVANPDIRVQADTIDILARYLDEHPDAVMAAPRVFNTDGTEQFLPKLRPKWRYLLSGRLERCPGPFKHWRAEYTRRDEHIEEPCDVAFISGCFFMIRTDALKELGGFDERFFMYFEDADLTLRAAKLGHTVFCPQAGVTHGWERASTHNAKMFFVHVASWIKFLWKYKGKKK
ncbi:MAG: glycosyltransferase family 2 protein [Oscillospiraceae bacterium]|nr:glycosyltransferase family 2 protein [Oscillospiraceae bacterium]